MRRKSDYMNRIDNKSKQIRDTISTLKEEPFAFVADKQIALEVKRYANNIEIFPEQHGMWRVQKKEG